MRFTARDVSMLLGISAASVGTWMHFGTATALMAFGGLTIGATVLSLIYGP